MTTDTQTKGHTHSLSLQKYRPQSETLGDVGQDDPQKEKRKTDREMSRRGHRGRAPWGYRGCERERGRVERCKKAGSWWWLSINR